MRFDFPFKPLPRFASVHGSTQPGPSLPDPDPAAPGAIPPGPAEPFPLEPGDIPAPAPPEPVEQPKEPEPEKVAARTRYLTATEEFNEFLLAENLRQSKAILRLETAAIAGLFAAAPTLNYLISAVSRLEPEDLRHCPDLAEMLHRSSTELADKLAPLCRKPVESPKLAVVG